jgi:asparagine synthetase B (glutamine-hydrolysing)
MCGIAGAINYKKFDLEEVKHALFHRGNLQQPDGYSAISDNC